jgi:hypothetical protein
MDYNPESKTTNAHNCRKTAMLSNLFIRYKLGLDLDPLFIKYAE